MKTVIAILDFLTAIMAIIASVIWYRSAKIKTSSKFTMYSTQTHTGFGEAVVVGNSPDLEKFAEALSKQSDLSAKAASFAAASAMAQSIAVVLRIFI